MIKSSYILLVDDEQDILSIAEFTLRTHYSGRILTVKSGNKAMTLIKEQGAPILVVSDYQMADGDGAELYRYLKASHPGTLFVVCSANSPESLSSHFPGVTSFVEKPAITGPLLKLIQKI